MSRNITAESSQSNFDREFPLLSQEFKSFKGDVEKEVQQINGRFDALERRLESWFREDRGRLRTWWPIISAILLVGWYIINLQNQSNTRSLADSITRIEGETK